MSNLFRRKHLSLVARSPLSSESPREIPIWKTGSLAEDGAKEITLYLFRESDVFRNSDFPGFLKTHNVRILFDARVAPRLDFVAANRILAFKKFEELEVNYIDMQGWISEGFEQSGNDVYDDLAHLVSERVRSLDIYNASIFFIFDSQDFLNRVNRSLMSSLNSLFNDNSLRFNVYAGEMSEPIAM